MVIGQKTTRKLFMAFLSLAFLVSGCGPTPIVDTNVNMRENNWTYPNKLTAITEVTDSLNATNLYFKLRVTADYRYSNIFILFTLQSPDGKKTIRRYGYKIAAADGQWLGKGSANLYTYKLPLLTNFRFPKRGTYQLTVEQNMRDNPLTGVSDGGILIENASVNRN